MAEPSDPVDRMSDVEALMWNLEKDPYLSAAFANLTVFDQPLDVARLRARLLRASQVVPRLRQRVVPAFGRLAPPAWQDDPDFDIDYHVRRVSLPGEGTERDLLDLAATLAAVPFDRTRPLWEFHIIEGLEGGRSAMVQKMHHTITDGEGGIRMSVEFIDIERDAPSPPPVTDDAGMDGATGSPHQRTLLDTAFETLTHNARRQAGLARRMVGDALEMARHPAQLAAMPGEAVATVQSVVRQLTLNDARRSPLWQERSLRRHFETLQIPLDDAKRTAKVLGGSVNDFFVAGAAGGAGSYHRELGHPVDALRISMPVSTRTDRSVGGNAFSVTRSLVPTDPDPVARFTLIHERLGVSKRERAVGVTAALAGVVNVLPTSALIRIARQQVETIDFATSNVKAAPFDLFIAGAKLEANYPIGPLGGTAFNLTTMSYRGMLDMGVHIDPVAVAEPGRLRRCLQESFDELIAAAG
jgi:WS/DGAT/MGAT family acyltransferase